MSYGVEVRQRDFRFISTSMSQQQASSAGTLDVPPTKSRHKKTPSDVAAAFISKAANVVSSQKGSSSATGAIPNSASRDINAANPNPPSPVSSRFPSSSRRHPSSSESKKQGFAEKAGFKFGKGAGSTAPDVRAFGDEHFAPDQYVLTSLRDTNEEGVRCFHVDLQQAKEDAAQDLKQNVYRNYNEFVVISNEISKLGTDMLVLRGLLNDLRSVSDALRDESQQFSSSAGASLPSLNITTQSPPSFSSQGTALPLQKRRGGSAGDKEMEEIWKAQLAALWDAVEGSQKYIPWQTGRHVIRESSNLVELNRSFKPRQAVHLFLLSDCLLVATRKRKTMTMLAKHKLIADKCWGLAEIALIDIKDSPDLSNAFKIMKHPDVFIYRTEVPEDKRSIMQTVKRVTDEFMLARRKERESTANDLPPTTSPTAPGYTFEQMPKNESASRDKTSPHPTRRAPQPQKGEISDEDVRWMADLADELDVFIAHHEFEEGVEGLEKAKTVLGACAVDSARLQQVRRTLEERVARLSAAISRDLSIATLTKSQVQQNINWLLRLGLGEQAREIFLKARSTIIRTRSRQLKFEGDISNYISELSLVVFTLIKNTCDWYGSSFLEKDMASGFVKWAKQEVELYADIFRRQVFNNHQKFPIIVECLHNAADQCRLLREVGMDLNFLLDQLFFSNILEAIEAYEARCLSQLDKAVKEDNFLVIERDDSKEGPNIEELGADAQVTISVIRFYHVVVEFLHDMGLLLNIPLYSRIVASVCSLIDGLLRKQLQALTEKNLTENQSLSILVNANYVIGSFIPRVSSQLSRRFDRPVSEIDTLQNRLRSVAATTQGTFCKKRGSTVIGKEFRFAEMDYSYNTNIPEHARPSEAILKLILELNKTASEIVARQITLESLLSGIIENIFLAMGEARCWETGAGQRKFGYGGVQQLVLDVHFFLKVCEAFTSEGTNSAANAVCERALRMYFAQNSDNKKPLKSGEWYDATVADAINELGGDFQQFGKFESIQT